MRHFLSCVVAFALTGYVHAAEPQAVPQWRAFWVDGFNPGIKTPEQVSQLVADLKSLNMNAVVVQMRKRGDALFRQSVEPFADESGIPAGFDPLADLLAKAHKEVIQVHAWANVGTIWPSRTPLDQAPAGHIIRGHGPSASGRDYWLTRDQQGHDRYETGYNADPGHPDYQSHYVRVVTELVRRYPVDGIHFDYVRYPELTDQAGLPTAVGYNPTSVERFNRVYGRIGLPDNDDPLWKAWRRQQVTQLVRRVRVELLDIKPQVLLSGALIPWGDGPGGNEAGWYQSAPYVRVFQDWHAWRKEGLLDLTVPMNYDREARPDQKRFYDNWIQFEKTFRYGSWDPLESTCRHASLSIL